MPDSEKPITRTWDEFWGPLLMVRFHQENPARWKVRAKIAEWIFKTLDLNPGARVLDIGCGDGLLDICLARLGAEVTAVDRISSVMKVALSEQDAELVTFVGGDIRQQEFASRSSDLVLMLDFIGLLSRDDESHLIGRVACWLCDGGCLLVDCPREPKKTETDLEREFDDGRLQVLSIYSPESRQLHIRPIFHGNDGSTIELCDCYANPLKQQLGVVRYLYPVEEISELLGQAGFDVQELDHPRSETASVLLAKKR